MNPNNRFCRGTILTTKCLAILIIITNLNCCEFINLQKKENNIFEVTDSKYEEMRMNCSKITNQSKIVFLGFILGSSAEEAQSHLNKLLTQGELKIMPGVPRLFEGFGEKIITETKINRYEFILNGIKYESSVSYELDLEGTFVKQISVDLDYQPIDTNPINFGDIFYVVELLKNKYGEPVRALQKDSWFNSYYWLKDGYEIEVSASQEKTGNEFYQYKIVFHLKFVDLYLEYSNKDLKSKRRIEKQSKGEEKMIKDL